jgi:hypothetical protein
MGTTQKALARGVPVCAVPHGRDQYEVARRVEVSRSGTRLPAKKLTPTRLKSKVLQAMSMTAGAHRVAVGFQATGGAPHGADVIERRLLGLAVLTGSSGYISSRELCRRRRPSVRVTTRGGKTDDANGGVVVGSPPGGIRRLSELCISECLTASGDRFVSRVAAFPQKAATRIEVMTAGPLHFLRRPRRIARYSSDSRAISASIELPGRCHCLAS